jgi:hypothetical protein
MVAEGVFVRFIAKMYDAIWLILVCNGAQKWHGIGMHVRRMSVAYT